MITEKGIQKMSTSKKVEQVQNRVNEREANLQKLEGHKTKTCELVTLKESLIASLSRELGSLDETSQKYEKVASDKAEQDALRLALLQRLDERAAAVNEGLAALEAAQGDLRFAQAGALEEKLAAIEAECDRVGKSYSSSQAKRGRESHRLLAEIRSLRGDSAYTPAGLHWAQFGVGQEAQALARHPSMQRRGELLNGLSEAVFSRAVKGLPADPKLQRQFDDLAFELIEPNF